MSVKGPYFLGYLFDTNRKTLQPYQDGIRVEATVTYTVGPGVDRAYCGEWRDPSKRSFMFGLLVDVTPGVTVDVEYKDTNGQWFALDKEDVAGGKMAIVSQLNTAPGTPAGKRWIAFSQPSAPAWLLDDSQVAKGVVQFEARVAIRPSAGPEFIPFVGRHLRDKDPKNGSFGLGAFSGGHMPSVWHVPKRP